MLAKTVAGVPQAFRVATLGAAVLAMSTAGVSPPPQLDDSSGNKAVQDHPINAAVDIGHQFLFYFDGRFGRAYLAAIGGRDAQIWASLSTADLTLYNLLVIEHDNSPCPYTDADIALVTRFVREGGGLLLIGKYTVAPGERAFRMNTLAGTFGLEFVKDKASGQLHWAVEQADGLFPPGTPRRVVGRASGILRYEDKKAWTPLMRDESGSLVAAARDFGKGRVAAVCGDSFFGDKPKDGDAINTPQTQAILRWLSANKTVDSSVPLRSVMPEKEKTIRGLRVQYPAYLESYAAAITDLYFQIHDELKTITGVPLSKGKNVKLILISTGGGGFSSGVALGIGAFWGGFPKNKYPIIEMIGHEATHSWVLPFGEPMWNEGIASYLGIEVGRKLGYGKQARAARQRWARSCEKVDPDYTKIDISQPETRNLHNVYMAKPMWIWDRLREKFGDDIIARYFQAKRRLIKPGKRKTYTADDCVAVLSIAAGEDLFRWFNSLGITVSREKSTVESRRTQSRR